MNEQQTALADALRDKGIPAEFAILIAQNSTHRNLDPLICMTPDEVLWSAFTWQDTEQGQDFWQGMAEAMYEEQRA